MVIPPRIFLLRKKITFFSSSVSRCLERSWNDLPWALPLLAIPPFWAHRISCFWIWSCSQTPLPTTSHLSWIQDVEIAMWLESGQTMDCPSWCFFLSVGERGNAKQQLDWYFLDQRFAHCFSWFMVIYLCNYHVKKNRRRNQSGTQPRHQKSFKADWSHNHTRTSIAKASFR